MSAPVAPATAAAPRSSTRWQRWGLLGSGLLLVCILAGVNGIVNRQIDLLTAASRMDTDGSVLKLFQFEANLLNLRDAVHELRAADEVHRAEALANLQARYEIFVSRVGLLKAPYLRQLAGDLPQYHEAHAEALGFVAFADPLFGEGMSTPDRRALDAALGHMDVLATRLHDLALAGHQAASEQAASRSATVLEQSVTVSILSLLLSATTLLFAWLAYRQFLIQRRRQRQLEALAQTLDDARVAAEAGSRTKSEFLATMSHELRTPFNGLLGMLEALGESPLGPQQRDHLRVATDSAEHLLGILDDVLDVSKLESGQLTVTPEPVLLPRLVHDTIALVATSAERKGLKLRVVIDPGVPVTVKADAQRLRQILLNLLSNAIKFSDHGLVSLQVQPVGPVGKRCTLSLKVSDTGIGMDEAALKRLFRRFSQADSSISRRYGGTGLGLEISRKLARLMEGDITVSSMPGLGSEFTVLVTLEVLAAAGAPAPGEAEMGDATPAPAVPEGHGLDVLVAEDHPVNRQVIERLLLRLGHRVRFAEDGEAAVRSAEAARPDLILMDLHMPVMDGFEATRLIRKRFPRHSGLPIIALSADVLATSRERALACGVDDLLAKPVRRADLARVLAGRAPMPSAASPTQTPVLDLAQLEALRQDFGEAGVSRLVGKLLSDQSGSFSRVLSALEAAAATPLAPTGADANADAADAAAALAAAAHALKGAAANLGLAGVSAVAADLETRARTWAAASPSASPDGRQALMSPEEAAESAEVLRRAWHAAREACEARGWMAAASPA